MHHGGAGSDPETPYGCGRGAVLTSDAPMEPTLSGDKKVDEEKPTLWTLARVRELCITGAGSDPETPYGCGRGAVLTSDAPMEPTLSGDKKAVRRSPHCENWPESESEASRVQVETPWHRTAAAGVLCLLPTQPRSPHNQVVNLGHPKPTL
ncbi:hypothetical protein MRX96_029884 [Rhipicephalus microplus]